MGSSSEETLSVSTNLFSIYSGKDSGISPSFYNDDMHDFNNNDEGDNDDAFSKMHVELVDHDRHDLTIMANTIAMISRSPRR